MTSGGCVPTTSGTCSAGYVYSNGTCVPSSGTNCPAGYVQTASGCQTGTGTGTPGGTFTLTPGCNEVVLSSSDQAAGLAKLVSLVQPSSIVASIWQFNNATHNLQAVYFNNPGAPTDSNALMGSQSAFVCVTGSGIVTT
jgi:hypothetical protein